MINTRVYTHNACVYLFVHGVCACTNKERFYYGVTFSRVSRELSAPGNTTIATQGSYT